MSIKVYKYSIFFVWLLTGSSVVGIILGYQEWFASKTFLNLSLFAVLLAINYPLETSRKILLALAISIIGIFIEVIGVQTGFPFGVYSYGENLGFKVCGVPLFIGINWLYLSLGTASLAGLFSKNRWVVICLASCLMVLLDVLIEPGAVTLDYWEFEQSPVPIQNYIGWFVISIGIHAIIQFGGLKENRYFTIHLIGSTLLFFTALLLF